MWTDSVWGIHQLEPLLEGFKEPLRRGCTESEALIQQYRRNIRNVSTCFQTGGGEKKKSFFRVLGNDTFKSIIHHT